MTVSGNHRDNRGFRTGGRDGRRGGRLCTALAVAAVLMTTVAAHAAQRMAVNVPKANIRSGPGTKYEILWQAERYYPVVVLKKKGQWVLFRDFEKDEGWIKKNLLAKTPTVITVKKECNIRSGPGTNFPIVFKTEDKGVPFKVLKTKGQWLQVQHADGDKGWIFKPLVW